MKENYKYPPPTPINDIKDKKLEEKLINKLNHIDEIENRKLKILKNQLKNLETIKIIN